MLINELKETIQKIINESEFINLSIRDHGYGKGTNVCTLEFTNDVGKIINVISFYRFNYKWLEFEIKKVYTLKCNQLPKDHIKIIYWLLEKCKLPCSIDNIEKLSCFVEI